MDNSSIIAAIIPSALFLLLILYYTVGKGGGYRPKIVKTKQLARVVGISTKTTEDSFIEDDILLWKEFKRIKNKNLIPNKKEVHSFVSLRMMPKPGERTWEYMIGKIVRDFDNIPVGFKTAEIKDQTYAAVHLTVKNEESWGPSIIKLEKYLYDTWLPKSDYELNTDSVVKSIVYHDKRTEDTTRTMIFYVAVRPKKKA